MQILVRQISLCACLGVAVVGIVGSEDLGDILTSILPSGSVRLGGCSVSVGLFWFVFRRCSRFLALGDGRRLATGGLLWRVYV